MKNIYIILILITALNLSYYSQTPLKFEKTFPISEKQKKLYKMASTWVEQQPNIKVMTMNDLDKIETAGFFDYTNLVVYEASKTISRSYAEQTKGIITFDLKMTIKDNELYVVIENFKHKSKNNIDKIDFGFITDSEKAPVYLMTEYDEEYCNNVWMSMKTLIKEQTEVLLTGIPENLVTVK